MKTSIFERKNMVDKVNSKINISRQCDLLSITRSSFYYRPKTDNKLNLELMRIIDEKHLKHPFMGVPSMTTWLRMDMNYDINPKRISRLFNIMGIHAIAPGPHTSKGNKKHKIYPYLLFNLDITENNQVWEIDITYVPMQKGFMYLVAIIDVNSRYVLNWFISNTMTAEWCRDTVDEAIRKNGKPQIINTDQGSQFTSEIFTSSILSNDIKISMDGKGRALDNIYIERLWRSVKYENIYLFSYSNGKELFDGLKEYFNFYNTERRHSSLKNNFPIKIYGKVA